jgi:hypothetical protein
MDLSALRVDREVARRLGVDGLQVIADRLDPGGDCVVCHRTLGKGPITLSLHWAGRPQDLALVAPAHAPCQPSVYVAGRPPALPQSHRTLALLSPVVGPVVLINHAVDVMLGSIVDGQWVEHLHLPTSDGRDLAEVDALSRIDTTTDGQLPPRSPHWGARLTRRGDLTLLSPSTRYGISAEPFILDAVRRAGRVLVLVTEAARISTIVETQSMDSLMQAIADHQVHGAWAVIDAEPTAVAFPARAPEAARSVPAGAHPVRSVAELGAMSSDHVVEARAVFSDHPAVRLTTGDVRVPVLLLEPRRMVMHTVPGSPTTDLNVKSAIDQGLARMPVFSTADDIEDLDLARDWSLRVTKRLGRVQLQLLAPFDQVIAEAPVRYSSRWHEAAVERGRVLVVYGPMVGVRAREGRPYADDDRHHELSSHRRAGMVAWGFVAWHERAEPDPSNV